MSDYYESDEAYYEKPCKNIWGFCYFFCCYCCIMYDKHKNEQKY